MSFDIESIYKEIGENDENQDVSGFLSSGFLPLNKKLSGKYDGGFPMGRMTEIFGGESSGKTLLATMAMIETQRRGGVAMFLDYEHAFYLKRAMQLGLSNERTKWIYKQPVTAEEGIGHIYKVCEMIVDRDEKLPVTVVVDSVASMVTKAELDGGAEDQNMKTKLSLASCLSQHLKVIVGKISTSNVTLIVLNQTRENPGVLYGDKTKTAGGNALKFYASVRLKLSKTGKVLDDDKMIIGENVKAVVIKNKVFEPFGECEYESSFVEGINLYSSHMNALKAAGKLGDKKGYLVFHDKSWRARELEAALRAEPALYEELLTMFFA